MLPPTPSGKRQTLAPALACAGLGAAFAFALLMPLLLRAYVARLVAIRRTWAPDDTQAVISQLVNLGELAFTGPELERLARCRDNLGLTRDTLVALLDERIAAHAERLRHCQALLAAGAWRRDPLVRSEAAIPERERQALGDHYRFRVEEHRVRIAFLQSYRNRLLHPGPPEEPDGTPANAEAFILNEH